jgi:hypothetical protein
MTVDISNVRAGDVVVLRDLTINTVKYVKPIRSTRRSLKLVFAETGMGYQYTREGQFYTDAESDVDVVAVVHAQEKGAGQ